MIHPTIPLLCLLAALPLASAARAEIVFRTRTDIAVGSSPTAFVLAQIDGPRLIVGRDDGLALVGPLDDDMPVAIRLAQVPFVKSLAVAPLTGDAHPDVACIAGSASVITILPGQGSREYGRPVKVALASRPQRLRARPFDASGTLGVFAVHDAGIALVRPARNGTFRVQAITDVLAADLEVTDVNRDGLPDVIAADPNENRVLVFAGQPDGTFARTDTLPSARGARLLALADANGDQQADLFVLGSVGVSYHLAQARGSFGPAETVWTESQLAGMAVGDIDADGLLDVAVTNASRAAVTLITGEGGGRFAPRHAYAVGAQPTDVLLADVTGDAVLDLLVLNHLSDSVTLLQGLGGGELAGSPVLLGSTANFTAMALADFDSDAQLDIAVTSEQGGSLTVFLGNGRGDFAALPPTTVGRQPHGLVAANLDGDRFPDLAIANFGGDEVAVLAGNGRGSFEAPRLVPVGLGPTVIVSGNLQGQGERDLAVANTLSDSVSILYADGRGGFPNVASFPVTAKPSFLLVGDVNNDRHPDLVVGNDYGDTVSILHGDGKRLGEPRTDRLQSSARATIAEDFDRDGFVDLVTVNEIAGTVDVRPGSGGGQFDEPRPFRVGPAPHSVAIGDFNHDGRADLAVLQREPPVISILLNRAVSPQGPLRTARLTGRRTGH